MKPLTRIVLIAAFLLLSSAAGTRTATAQTCFATTFANNTKCDVIICLGTLPLAVVTCSPVLASGGSTQVFVPSNPPVTSVVSAGLNSYLLTPSPIPGVQWVPNVTLAPAGCCCDVYYDPLNCTVKAVPTTSPGPCNP